MKFKNFKHKKIIFLILIFLLLIIIGTAFILFWPTKKVYHVGIISGTDFFVGTDEGFIRKMSELGYRENVDIVYDVKKINNDLSEANKIIEKFLKNKVDLIFSFPTNVAVLSKELTQNTKIPVVFGDATIEGTGLVKDVNFPGDNITGVRQATIETVVERFDLMHELVPNAKKYLIFYQSDLSVMLGQLRELALLAEKSGVDLILKPVDSTSDIDFYLKEQENMSSFDFDAILTIIEPVANIPSSSQILSVFAEKYKIPFGGAPLNNEACQNLFGVSIDNVLAGSQAAVLADKVLRGVPAGSIPVVTAEKYIQINLKMAEKLGLKIDDSLISRANIVIR